MTKLHIPVCTAEILKNIPAHSVNFLDATLGRGGHTRAFFDHFPNIRVMGIDCDIEAIEYAQKHFNSYIQSGQLRLFHKNFFDVDSFLTKSYLFDVILIDLGVSSPQLDEPLRGFSFYYEGPLDMRFDQSQSLKASDLIRDCSEKELIYIFQNYGEIKSPYKVAKAIFSERKKKPFITTTQLASFIAEITGWKQKGQHPATNYFRALRIVVNNELEGLKVALISLMKYLKSKGCLFVISFNSLEDRIVKWTFRKNKDLGYPLYKKVIVPSVLEQKSNPRCRSGKLRIFQRLLVH